MRYRNNPHIQAQIYQARQKKQEQLRQTANIFFVRGARAAAKIAKDAAGDPMAVLYELESVILWKLKLLAPGRRILKGSDMTKDTDVLIEEARNSLNGSTHEADLIAVSVNLGRSEFEAWEIHESLTGIAEDDLDPKYRGKIVEKLARRFPALSEDEEKLCEK